MRLSSTGLVLFLALACSASHPARADEAAGLYDLSASAPKKVAKGAEGTLSVTITPHAGAEIHKEAPITLALSTPGHLTLSKTKLGRPDMKLEGGAASFRVPFTATSSGASSIDGSLRFYICTAKSCTPQERKLSVPVQVR